MKTFSGITLEQMETVAGELIALKPDSNLWTFRGDLGAGKTTLIKALCKVLGVAENVSSPTFSLVNEYHTASGKPVYHFDFYRIKHLSEVYDIGYEDYFYSGNLCLIEWPEKIEELLQNEHVLQITLTHNGNSRTIQVDTHTP